MLKGIDPILTPDLLWLMASMGHGDEETLTAALAGGAGYVGLVASARRAQAVSAELRDRGLDEEAVARIQSPAGLDLGPSTQEEIAVAILAELVAWRHTTGVSPAEEVGEAIDPICGMTVAIAGARETLELDGTTWTGIWAWRAACRAASRRRSPSPVSSTARP